MSRRGARARRAGTLRRSSRGPAVGSLWIQSKPILPIDFSVQIWINPGAGLLWICSGFLLDFSWILLDFLDSSGSFWISSGFLDFPGFLLDFLDRFLSFQDFLDFPDFVPFPDFLT